MEWFYYAPGGKIGPLSEGELCDHALEGRLRPGMVVENGSGEQAAAESIEGLTFPSHPSSLPIFNGPLSQPPLPQNPPKNVSTAPKIVIPQPPMPKISSTQRCSPVNYEQVLMEELNHSKKNEAKVDSIPPEPPTSASEPYQSDSNSSKEKEGESAKKQNFWDFDLAGLLDDSGTTSNENLIQNCANVFKMYFWIFAVLYWLYTSIVLLSLAFCFCSSLAGNSSSCAAASFWGLVFGFLLSLGLFFLFWLLFKLPIELLKYVLVNRNQLKELQEKLNQKNGFRKI